MVIYFNIIILSNQLLILSENMFYLFIFKIFFLTYSLLSDFINSFGFTTLDRVSFPSQTGYPFP